MRRPLTVGVFHVGSHSARLRRRDRTEDGPAYRGHAETGHARRGFLSEVGGQVTTLAGDKVRAIYPRRHLSRRCEGAGGTRERHAGPEEDRR